MKYLLLFLSIFYISTSIAQTPGLVTDRVYQSIDYLKHLKQEFGITDSLSKYERLIQDELRFEDSKDHIIPIVFHVLHFGLEGRVSEQKIAQQIELLNQDFAGETVDTLYTGSGEEDRRNLEQYAGRKANTQIQFCLPTETPLGLPTLGVNYVPTLISEFTDFSAMKTIESGILGLYPLWGEDQCQDDYVADTPIHNAPNRNPSNSKHISLCSGYPTEMTNNFMDSNTDGRVSMFTKRQARRMQMALSEKGPRGRLSL